MNLFGLRKPRGFHHEYMFADRRKERLNELEARVKGDSGPLADYPSVRDRIHGSFLNATKHTRRRSERRVNGGLVLSFGVIVVLLLFLFMIWRMLLVM